MIDLDSAPVLRPIFYMIGVSCLLIGGVWLLQALLLGGTDGSTAVVAWVILGAAVAGVGAAFLLAGHYWMGRDGR